MTNLRPYSSLRSVLIVAWSTVSAASCGQDGSATRPGMVADSGPEEPGDRTVTPPARADLANVQPSQVGELNGRNILAFWYSLDRLSCMCQTGWACEGFSSEVSEELTSCKAKAWDIEIAENPDYVACAVVALERMRDCMVDAHPFCTVDTPEQCGIRMQAEWEACGAWAEATVEQFLSCEEL